MGWMAEASPESIDGQSLALVSAVAWSQKECCFDRERQRESERDIRTTGIPTGQEEQLHYGPKREETWQQL